MPASLAFNFETYHKERRDLIEEKLSQYLSETEPAELWDSMRYSVLSGGKRIRAVLCLASAEASSHFLRDASTETAAELALPCACAIEMIHAMSLIHDDLPCMDDDDFRRGRPSNHKVYGEAMALLAGDALLVYASEILLQKSSDSIDKKRLIDVSSQLLIATGAKGMVGGQVCDMAVTGLGKIDARRPEELETILSNIHRKKTGALIRFSIYAGAALMNAPEAVLNKLTEFGELLGFSFQIADDLLDVTGDIKTLGKTPGKDEKAGKITWVTVYGLERAQKKLSELEERGKSILAELEIPAEKLQALAALLEYAIHRSN